MLSRFKKLSTQIIGMLLIFFVVALGAIGMTLALSWQLEGGSAAINDAGSERMRSYRFSHLMALGLEPGADRVRVDAALAEEITLFEKLLADIGRHADSDFSRDERGRNIPTQRQLAIPCPRATNLGAKSLQPALRRRRPGSAAATKPP